MVQMRMAGFQGVYFPVPSIPKPTPVLCIHGAFADHKGLNKIASLFAANGYRSFAFSRRGRLGEPPEKARGITFDDYLQDTLSVIKNIHPAPVLVGHSLGGLLALKAVEQATDIPALVLINTAPPAMLTAQPIALPFFFPLLPKIFLGKSFKPSIQAFKTLALNMMGQYDQERIAHSLIEESGIVYRDLMLGKIKLNANQKQVPTLVIGSVKDRIISKGLNKITVHKTNALYKEYPHHGHWIIEEEGVEQVVQDIIYWLQDVL